jgi:uncharacterized membrane protein YdjX (TVP38/TMEM64 family)
MNKKPIKKIGIVAVIVCLFVLFKVFHLEQYFALSYLKSSKERFVLLYQEHKAVVIVSYMLIYILSTSVSLPGATVLSLAGGAIFGLVLGTLIVSFASTIGATLACFVSRFVLRDWVQKRLGDRLHKINEGIEREGKFYLFSLRLIPVFPFWMINLAMGLTHMPLKTFYWVSQIGMLPGTIIYVNAGRELAKIESLKDIFSPGMIISFALLGIFPLVARKTVNLYKRRLLKQ